MKNQHEAIGRWGKYPTTEGMPSWLSPLGIFFRSPPDTVDCYDLPCTYCLPIWERTAARERGDKPQVTSNESFTSDFS